jgi:hypothetical protein
VVANKEEAAGHLLYGARFQSGKQEDGTDQNA